MNTTPSPAIEAVELPEPAAWVSFNVLTQKESIGRLPVTSLQPGVYQHSKLYSADQVSALLAAKQEEVDKMREVIDAVRYARDWYEKLGEVCSFEGMPMIYASALLELGEKADAAPPLPAQVQAEAEGNKHGIERVINRLESSDPDFADCEDAVVLLRKYRKLCQEIGRGDSYHLHRIEKAALALEGEAIASRTPAPGMAGGVGADTFTFDPAGLRMLWNAVGEPGNFNGDFMVAARRLAASTSPAAVEKEESGLYRALDLIVNCDALAEPLADAKRRDPDDEEQRQQRIETVLYSGRRALAAYDAAPHPSPAVQVAGAEKKLIPYIGHDAGKPELWLGYMDEQGCYMPVAGPDRVPKSWLTAIEAGRAGS